jgi:hypothetical protein
MNDGHSGIKSVPMKQGNYGGFDLTLAWLEQANGQVEIVIHATCSSSCVSGLEPWQFLESIEFKRFEGNCQFYSTTCFHKVIATIRGGRAQENSRLIAGINVSFNRFSNEFTHLWELSRERHHILENLPTYSWHEILPIFGPPIDVKLDEKEIPTWVEPFKFSQLVNKEVERNRLQEEIDDLTGYLPLLYGTGDTVFLESVIKALRLFGLNAERTPKGYTVDIFAESSDGTKKFGFEVTGLSDAIKKENKKLTQVLDFERIKEHNQKTVLVANTYNTTPISERKGPEDFTKPVIDFLGRHPILLMTTWNLYCMVSDILDGKQQGEAIIELLYTRNGRLDYQRP